MSNLDLWNRFADIDPAFTKAIKGKQYKGTSPNPQYVIKCLTELFGPVGKGFGWEVVHEEFVPLGNEVLHLCRIRFWHGNRDTWFESYGQTKALLVTQDGRPLVDEDAPKKSLTDAIVKAASHIGIAANIFLGRWDDQKYVQSVADSFNGKGAEQEPPTRSSAALKRDGEWEKISEQVHQELLDVHTLAGLETVRGFWREFVRGRGWTPAWKAALKNIFDGKEQELMAAMEAAEMENT